MDNMAKRRLVGIDRLVYDLYRLMEEEVKQLRKVWE
jgi:hypothetical protein